ERARGRLAYTGPRRLAALPRSTRSSGALAPGMHRSVIFTKLAPRCTPRLQGQDRRPRHAEPLQAPEADAVLSVQPDRAGKAEQPEDAALVIRRGEADARAHLGGERGEGLALFRARAGSRLRLQRGALGLEAADRGLGLAGGRARGAPSSPCC